MLIKYKQILKIKGLIRNSEAFSAAKFCGIQNQNIYFLDLPFYETGKVKKRPIGSNIILKELKI